MTDDRKDVLLRAAHDLLQQCHNSFYVKSATSVVVHYDDADCDGECLMRDIAIELGIDDDN